MKKIGIVTLFSYHNYGNRLQMFASQKIYENLGFRSEIIRHEYLLPLKNKIKKALINLSETFFKNSEKKLKDSKIKRFEEHSKKYFHESKDKIYSNKLPESYHENYDYFSVGSDQIWSPGPWNYKRRDFVFLKFAPKEKRIALSPSFGKSEIPSNFIKGFSEGLLGIENLSVREEAGAKIIEKIADRKSQILVDPTMILKKEEWMEFSEKHEEKPNKKYILTYFLGAIPEKARKILDKYAKEDQYEIVQLCSFEMKKYYDANPSEWVDFVKDADLFLTDSFHGVVFAHILETPFVVYDRIGGKSMNSRITTILKKFNMEHRHELDKNTDNLFDLDFSNVESIIKHERKKTMNYLRNALDINNEVKNEEKQST